jgi:hypothetical protein
MGIRVGIQRGLTARQLLDEHRSFMRQLPTKLTPQIQRRWQSVRIEILRREDAEDPDLFRIVCNETDAEAALLPPPVSENAADFEPQKLLAVATSSLRRQLQECESKLEELKRAYPDRTSTRNTRVNFLAGNWLEKLLIERNEQALQDISLNIRRELVRRGEVTSGAGINTIRVVRKPNPDVAARRAIVARNPSLNAEKLCKQFDAGRVPLPFEGASSWVEARHDSTLRKKIDVILSKDRKLGTA